MFLFLTIYPNYVWERPGVGRVFVFLSNNNNRKKKKKKSDHDIFSMKIPKSANKVQG